MVRTKACSASMKAVAAKAPRKVLAVTTSDSSSPAGKGKYAGGNPAHPRPTPSWQKGMDLFLSKSPQHKGKENRNSEIENEEQSGSSSSQHDAKAKPSSQDKKNEMNAESDCDSDNDTIPARKPVIESDDDDE